jgi:AcrR family transcriptional regulator
VDDLREACIQEAFAIIGEHGLEGLSLREVARRLGVSHQAPYRHFASRDHILAEVVAFAFQDFAAYLDNRPRSGDPAEDMASMGRAYLRYALQRPLHYRLMFETELPNPQKHPGMLRDSNHAFSLLREAIRNLGRPHAQEDVDTDALFVWAVVHGWSGVLRGHTLDHLEIKKRSRKALEDSMLERIGRAMGLS